MAFLWPVALGWIVLLLLVIAGRLTQLVSPTGLSVALEAGFALTALWLGLVLATQEETASVIPGADGKGTTVDAPKRREFWRARTVAWGLLGISLVGLVLLALVLVPGGPYSVIPEADLPLVEVAVLVCAVLLAAQLVRYTAMVSAANTAELSEVLRANALEEKVDRLEQHTELVEAIARASDEISRTLKEIVTSARGSQAQVLKEKLARLERIAPRIAVRLRVQGTLTHGLWVDLYNEGWTASGVRLVIREESSQGPTNAWQIDVGQIPTKSAARSISLGDVAGHYLRSKFSFQLEVQDADANTYTGLLAGVTYLRVLGTFGILTRRVEISPDTYTWVALTRVSKDPEPAH